MHVIPVIVETTPDPAPRDPIRIEVDEPLPMAMRRITVAQFDRMIPALTRPDDVDTGIHLARKSMKRVRGLIRLVRDEIGYDVYRNENVVLRDVARQLAPARDGYILIETLERVIKRFSPLVRKHGFDETRAWLRLDHRRHRASVTGNAQLMSNVVFTLKASSVRFAGGPALIAAHGDPFIRDEFVAIEGGLHRVYRRGRRAYRRSLRHADVATLHEWRKRVKYLRYQMEALTPLWPEVIGAQADALDELGDLLGEDHDLAVLHETIMANADACPDRDARWLIELLIERLRSELQQQALVLGEKVYTEKPDAFVERMHGYWDAARPA